jgi:hypothetical protein
MSDPKPPVRLQLTFRHFTEALLDNLGPVNILIGQNNAGKTSLFRGIADTVHYWAQDPLRREALTLWFTPISEPVNNFRTRRDGVSERNIG